jgi:hypothetical protein
VALNAQLLRRLRLGADPGRAPVAA